MSLADQVAWPQVHPASKITSWAGWPDDVRPTLLAWNRSGRLTFVRRHMWVGWMVWRDCTFKCVRCDEFHVAPSNGIARFDGCFYCDPCMISLAQEAVRQAV